MNNHHLSLKIIIHSAYLVNRLTDLNKLQKEQKQTSLVDKNKNFSLANLHYNNKLNQKEVKGGIMFDYMLKKTGAQVRLNILLINYHHRFLAYM